ncbi:MAG: IclR family transcriptional regulator [Thermoplasmata archaeon]|nr:IclR family transcriptional regulator [Thermoplasmata archaeon]
MSPKQSEQGIARSLKILETLSENQTGLNLLKLADQTKLSPATASRILHNLALYDYVYQNPYTKAYFLGSRLIRLGEAARSQNIVIEVATESLKEMASLTNENANLAILKGNQAVYINQVKGSADWTGRIFTQIGAQVPLHSTGVGKAILAYSTEDFIRKVINNGLETFTKTTIIDTDILFSELARIRKLGYAVDNEENEIGVKCVASPIISYSNEVLGAVSISGPASRITEARFEELGALTRKAGLKISKQLGFQDEGFSEKSP